MRLTRMFDYIYNKEPARLIGCVWKTMEVNIGTVLCFAFCVNACEIMCVRLNGMGMNKATIETTQIRRGFTLCGYMHVAIFARFLKDGKGKTVEVDKFCEWSFWSLEVE
uniref:Transmembrane protein n=1 Tax=Panagrellus redivivus TaxID=6233 RepID=A0A7E4ZPZ7_PANRE